MAFGDRVWEVDLRDALREEDFILANARIQHATRLRHEPGLRLHPGFLGERPRVVAHWIPAGPGMTKRRQP
jgi:hypothetical protein